MTKEEADKEDDMDKETSLPVLGFLGTGTINSALVRAICRTDGPRYPIVVSPRSAERVAALQAEFPEQVSIAASMQEVVDRADIVFMAVLPKAVEEVYKSLSFPKDMHIVDLIPRVTEEQVRLWTGVTGEIDHIIPLAFVADVPGPIIMYPASSSLRPLLERIGLVVALDDRRQVAAAQILTCFEAPFFTLLDRFVDWGVGEGMDREAVCSFVTSMFRAMSDQVSRSDRARLHELADEFTPGGYNWRAKESIDRGGGFDLWLDMADELMAELSSGLGK